MGEPPPPRNPEWIKTDLRRLHAQRTQAQDELMRWLTSIDALDELIETRVDELARTHHIEETSP